MEPIETINQRLIDYYGKDVVNGLALYRVVWSHDEFEKRLMNHSDAGIELLHPEVREVPKYRGYIRNKWILEQLTLVPEFQQKELGIAISYEPLFVFETNDGKFLPYKWEAIVFVIESVRAVQGNHQILKDTETSEERIDKLEADLFGNETKTTDALAHRRGVGYTGPSKMVN